ncbi:MAG: hypothetical protein ACI4M3_06650 [Acutalibacteraceae bacterium]
MKLLMKRDCSDLSARFVVMDESGHEKYLITGKLRPSCQILYVENTEKERIAEITHYTLIVNHFSVRYDKRQLSVVPQFNHGFTLMLFGSSMTFSGTADLCRFRLSDVDHSTVMIMEKKISPTGEYFELNIKNPHHERLCLCTAICTAVYLTAKSDSRFIPCDNA